MTASRYADATTEVEVEALFASLLGRWNDRDASGYSALFTEDGSLVGFDGSSVESAAAIDEHMRAIFADHQPATYVAKVREVRALGPDTTLLRAVAGMAPPGANDIKPEVNAIQVLVAVRRNGAWRVAHFQNTPAAFHGQPEAAQALTAELRAVRANT